jgi:transcriptional regulator with XRE-family HTH domain
MDERERLIEIMKSQELNSKQLSLELGVSAGTISNILGGRNKPSLEFLQNVANHFPFINPTWLFLGFGEKYIDGYVPEFTETRNNLFSQIEPSASTKSEKLCDEYSSNDTVASVAMQPCSARTVQKIVIFYSDGTFEER